MQGISKISRFLGLAAVILVVVFGYQSIRELTRDKSVIQQSGWRDNGGLSPWASKWAFSGHGEMLNVYGFALMDLETGDFDILKLEGTFPNCRYFSLSLHAQDMRAENYNLKDNEIIPDEGYINPFVAGNERKRGQKYTAYLVNEGVEVDPSLKNVLIIPKHFKEIVLATRQYRTDDDTPLEEVAKPYPKITALSKDMTLGIAPISTGRIPFDALNDVNFDVMESVYDLHHDFQKNNGNPNSIDFLPYGGEGMGPNNDTKYLGGILGDDFSKVAVIGMAKAPTYENTRQGGPFVGGKNVRYWSFCHAEGRMGMVNDCVNDDRMKLNSDGSVTLVVGPASVKEAVETAGLTYLPWTRNRMILKPLMTLMYAGNKTYDPDRNEKKTLVIFRQVLADEDWEGALLGRTKRYFQFLTPEYGVIPAFDPRMDERAELVIGEAGPRGVVLDVDTFVQGLKKGDFNKAFDSNYAYAAN